MQFSQIGDPAIPGQEPILGPGVRGCAFDMENGIYIPMLIAEDPGTGQVSAFLDSLPTDKRVVFPTVLNGRLSEMLLRRGFHTTTEDLEGELVEVMERVPGAPQWVSKIDGICLYALYNKEGATGEEEDCVLVQGIEHTLGFQRDRLESKREDIVEILQAIVPDDFIVGLGGGFPFSELYRDREGVHWGEHRPMESLLCLAMGLGLAGYCLPRDEFWGNTLTYVWFSHPPLPK